MFEHTVIQLHNTFPSSVMKISHISCIDETLFQILHFPVWVLHFAFCRKQQTDLVQTVQQFIEASSYSSLPLPLSALYPSAVRSISFRCPLYILPLSALYPSAVRSISFRSPLYILPLSALYPSALRSISFRCPPYILLLSALYPSAVRSISFRCPLYILLLSALYPPTKRQIYFAPFCTRSQPSDT